MSNQTVERRKHPRKRVSVQSLIANHASRSDCVTVDLSANGLFCRLDHPLSVFTKVKITLMIPSTEGNLSGNNHLKPVDCEGVVVRSDEEPAGEGLPSYATAIFFNRIDDESVGLIQKYVASHKH